MSQCSKMATHRGDQLRCRPVPVQSRDSSFWLHTWEFLSQGKPRECRHPPGAGSFQRVADKSWTEPGIMSAMPACTNCSQQGRLKTPAGRTCLISLSGCWRGTPVQASASRKTQASCIGAGTAVPTKAGLSCNTSKIVVEKPWSC